MAEDKMEMASPYQGHVDDFDIDIDIMEDQASTTDKDMMLADDFQEPSNEVNNDQEGAHDADMIDDIAEPTMADAEDAFADEGYNIEMQYGSDRDYEADMIEDDYDEDLDAPVMDADAQPSLEQSNNHAEQGQGSPDGNAAVDGQKESHEELHQEPHEEPRAEQVSEALPSQHDETQLVKKHSHESAANQAEDGQLEDGQLEDGQLEDGEVNESPLNTNEAEHEDSNLAQAEQQVNNATEPIQPQASESHSDEAASRPNVEEGEKREEVVEEVEQEAKEIDGQEVEPIETKNVEEAENEVTAGQDVQQQAEQAVEVTEHEALYPVKVYYQETEISLFPPREGDSSETFFLEDENLAYGPFADLLEACRNVLQEHVGEKDVLIMDVDALNLQLAEDSTHMGDITLFQIVDLYLRLCHNEGIDEPEPLYLSLSTRLTPSAELSDLLAAANEGKGLTDIHTWDSYAEVEAVSAEFYEGIDEVPHSDLPQEEEHAFEPEEDKHVGTEIPESVSHRQQCSKENDGESNVEDHQPSGAVPSADGVDENASGEGINGEVEAEAEGQTAISEHNEEESLQLEEQSQSSATVTQLPPAEMAEEQQADGESASVANEQRDENEYEYNDVDADPVESYSEEDAHVQDIESLEVDQLETGEDAEAAQLEQPPALEEGPQSLEENSTVASPSHEDAKDTPLLGDDAAASHEASEDDLNESFQDGADTNSRPTLDLGDDAIDFVDNLPESPRKYSEDEEGEVANADEFEDLGEFDNETEQTPLLTADDDDEDFKKYLDAFRNESGEFADEASGKAPSHPSIKRHREPEDEVELIETPSPDAKRSRSS
ncbi:uncharacterized protein BO97DRAFT_410388 [Aspergillus homomorphus CBS 101889]|uniref:Uncharacterized protein n=1 Tax=Aspergillus homomorphus (strain CBS 101889) TaxID=1450537 RepID=A0A395ICJ6_ASPHC|nr:hypothetical protein BO97DRAFT_410388 [Aspergillus homomorphus CBS 101889]RAL16873.1 hypothetical protein BO97DRAFT_410388 [Aspergillus homomorphus CBS 101889]